MDIYSNQGMTIMKIRVIQGLVVAMHGSQAWIAGSSLHLVPISGLAWSLYRRAALYRAERLLETFRGEKGISSRFRVAISSRYDQSC